MFGPWLISVHTKSCHFTHSRIHSTASFPTCRWAVTRGSCALPLQGNRRVCLHAFFLLFACFLFSCLSLSDEVTEYHSAFAIEAQHRHAQVPIPASHARLFLPRPTPAQVLINMKPWSTAFNIAGYCHDGSFRYEKDKPYKLLQSRVISYFSDDHSTRDRRYNGSLVVLPHLYCSKTQAKLWVDVSRVLGQCTGLHFSHRLEICSLPESVQLQMYVPLGLFPPHLALRFCHSAGATAKTFCCAIKTACPIIRKLPRRSPPSFSAWVWILI